MVAGDKKRLTEVITLQRIILAFIFILSIHTARPLPLFPSDIVSRDEMIEEEVESIAKETKSADATETAVAQPQQSAASIDKGAGNTFPLIRLEVETQVSRFIYREPGLMRDEGNFYGLSASFMRRSSDNRHIKSIEQAFRDERKFNMFKLEGRFLRGYVDYESQDTGKMSDVKDYLYELRGLWGYDFSISERSRITPFMGIGYRYLNDDSGGRQTTTGHYGYERESSYSYIPLGFEFERPLEGKWLFNISAEYDLFLRGRQRSHLEDVAASLNMITNDQDKGYGLKGILRLSKKTKNTEFLFEPYVYYWNIEESAISAVTYSGLVIASAVEPDNDSTEYGIRLGIRY